MHIKKANLRLSTILVVGHLLFFPAAAVSGGPVEIVKEFAKAFNTADVKRMADLSCKPNGPLVSPEEAARIFKNEGGGSREISGVLRAERLEQDEKANIVIIRMREPLGISKIYYSVVVECKGLPRVLVYPPHEIVGGHYPITEKNAKAYLLNNIAWYYSSNNLYIEKAIRLAKEANRLSPKSHRVLDTLAWSYFKAGKYEKAYYTMKKLADKKGRVKEVYAHRWEQIRYKLWKKWLSSSDQEKRYYAAEKLWRAGDRSGETILVARWTRELQSASLDKRKQAAENLWELRGKASAPALTSQLQKELELLRRLTPLQGEGAVREARSQMGFIANLVMRLTHDVAYIRKGSAMARGAVPLLKDIFKEALTLAFRDPRTYGRPPSKPALYGRQKGSPLLFYPNVARVLAALETEDWAVFNDLDMNWTLFHVFSSAQLSTAYRKDEMETCYFRNGRFSVRFLRQSVEVIKPTELKLIFIPHITLSLSKESDFYGRKSGIGCSHGSLAELGYQLVKREYSQHAIKVKRDAALAVSLRVSMRGDKISWTCIPALRGWWGECPSLASRRGAGAPRPETGTLKGPQRTASIILVPIGGIVGIKQVRGFPQILDVKPGSPADRAGLRVGDLVTHVDGKEIRYNI